MEYQIKIKNLRTDSIEHVYDVKVDRSSPLGNPFFMRSESERDLVCNNYEQWLLEQITNKNRLVCDELNRLYKLLKTHGKLNLFCWCSPKRCHAETIRLTLLKVL